VDPLVGTSRASRYIWYCVTFGTIHKNGGR